MLSLILLSRRYWQAHPGRLVTMLSGTALGVALVLSVVLINQSILATYSELIRDLAGRTQLEVKALSAQGLDERLLLKLSELSGVAALSPRLEQDSFLLHEAKTSPLLLRGIDPEASQQVQPLELAQGRMLHAEDKDAVLLSEPLFESLGASLNEALELFTPEGLRAYRIVGTFSGLESLGAPQGRMAVMPLASMQKAYTGGEQLLSQIDIRLSGNAHLATTIKALRQVTEGLAFVEEPLERVEALRELSKGVRFMLFLSALIALVAAAYLMTHHIFASLHERAHELAVLRALGMAKRKLRFWLLGELGLIGLTGALVGATLSWGLAQGFIGFVSARLFTDLMHQVSLTPSLHSVLLSLGLGVSVVLLAGLLGLHWLQGKALAMSLAGRVAVPRQKRRQRKHYLFGLIMASLMLLLASQLAPGPLSQSSQVMQLGLTLTVMFLLAVCLPGLSAWLGQQLGRLEPAPVWLRLAADSLQQHRRRTGAVAASLMVTLSILVAVFGTVQSYRSSVSSWVNDMYGWDLMVSTRLEGDARGPTLNEADGEVLRQIPGIALASPERYGLVAYGPYALHVHAFDMETFSTFRRFTSLEGVPSRALPAALKGHRRVAVSSSLAPVYDLRLGDSLSLSTPNGPKDYEIAAIVHDPGAAVGAIYMDRFVYVRDLREAAVDSYAVLLEPAADALEVAAAIRSQLDSPYPLQVVNATYLKTELNRKISETFGLSQGLILLAVFVSLVGLVHAGLIAAWQLRHQFVTLRALGASFRLVAMVLLAEAWLMGVLGGLIGLLMGTLLSSVLLTSMQRASTLVVDWVWPTGAYLWVLLIALVGSLLAGTIPARAAAKVTAQSLRFD